MNIVEGKDAPVIPSQEDLAHLHLKLSWLLRKVAGGLEALPRSCLSQALCQEGIVGLQLIEVSQHLPLQEAQGLAVVLIDRPLIAHDQHAGVYRL